MVKENTIKDTIKDLNKKYGGDCVTSGGGIDVEFIDTGCFSLNHILGCGGFPRGRVVEIFGKESSGKTTMALFFAAQVQKNGGTVVWVDAEACFDSNYAEKIGVDTKKLVLNRPMSGEEAFTVLEKMILTNDVDLVVVDSVAALVPQKELDGDIEDVNVALQARLMSKGLRVITSALAETKTSVLFINQIRQKIGIFYGPSDVTCGGNALKFYSSIRLSVRKGNKKDFILNDNNDVIGNTLYLKCEKNKVGLPFRETSLDLYFSEGIDIIGDILDFALKNSIVKKSGITYNYKDVKLGAGRDKAKKFLEDNGEVLNSIKTELESLMSKTSDVAVEVVKDEESEKKEDKK